MKKIKTLITLIWLCVSSYSYADHASGGYFEYTCLGNNQYLVEFTFLRHCAGPSYPQSVDFTMSNSCSTACGQWVVSAPLFHSEDVAYGCNTGCGNNNNAPNFQMAKYSATITLPYACSDWMISTVIEWRQSVEFGIFGSGGSDQTYFNYCKINNTSNNCNSSVRVSGYPITMGCVNQAGKSLYSITPNNNIITYEMAVPLAGSCSSPLALTYEGGASVTQPLPSTSDFVVGTNGSLTYYPVLTGAGFFALSIKEYENNNNFLGEIRIDGITYSSNSVQCGLGSTVNFSDFVGEGDNTISATEVDKTYCGTFKLKSNNNGEDIAKVTVQAPDYAVYQIVYNPDGTATVEVCVVFPPESLCSEVDAVITVTASTTDASCLAAISQSGYKGYYHFVKSKGAYCPKNVYITDRSPSTVPMPVYAKAQDTIWVGDKMPASAPFGVTGNVIGHQNVTLVAGREVILPSCINPGCVTLTAGTSIYIKPNNCSVSCEKKPVSLWVKEQFNCSAESLIAFAEGDGPFLYQWNVNGNITTTTGNIFDIHNVVSTTNGGSIPYTVTVIDAVGGTGSFSGTVMGTKRFYEDIRNNTKPYDFPVDALGNPSTINGLPGNYYGASIYCVEQHPSYFFDDVNSGPPWYGATRLEFIVRHGWGGIIYSTTRNLEGGDDWSFDNGEIYWNGHENNNMSSPCIYPTSDVVPYTLEARNCYTKVHQEVAAISFHDGIHADACTRADSMDYYLGTIKVAKSTGGSGNGGEQYNNGNLQNDRGLGSKATSTDFYITCVPNPTQNTFVLKSNQKKFVNVQLLDQTGKVVMEFVTLEVDKVIDVSNLSTGIYTLVLEGHHIKILKE